MSIKQINTNQVFLQVNICVKQKSNDLIPTFKIIAIFWRIFSFKNARWASIARVWPQAPTAFHQALKFYELNTNVFVEF